MPYLKFRYHLVEDVADGRVRDYLKSFSEHLIIQHEADQEVSRTHWHALLWSDASVQTTRGRLKTTLPFLTKSGYSLGLVKAGTETRYVQYMCHMAGPEDPVNVVARQSLRWPQSELDELNLKYWEEHRTISTPPEEHPVDHRPKFCEQLLEYCKTRQVDLANPREIVPCALHLCKLHRKAPQAYFLDSCVNFVLLHDTDGFKLLEQRLLRPWTYA